MADESDVDYRFLLANERTFLAWIRTALGIIAGGVALDQFVSVAHDDALLHGISLLVIALGVVVAITGTVRWSRADDLMRAGRPMGRSRLVIVVGACVALAGIILGVLLWRLG